MNGFCQELLLIEFSITFEALICCENECGGCKLQGRDLGSPWLAREESSLFRG